MNNLPDWTTGEFLYLALVCAGFLAFSGALMWASLQDRTWGMSLGKRLEACAAALTDSMAAWINHDGPRAALAAQLAVLVLFTVIVLPAYGREQIKFWPALMAVVMVMVLLSFIFCAYETAIAIYGDEWKNKGPPRGKDLISRWLAVQRKRSKRNKIKGWYFQLNSTSFWLLKSYLDRSPRSLASLLVLGAAVDVIGTVLVANLVNAGPVPQPILEAVIVTVPLVLFGHLSGTIIGMRRPVKTLIGLAIPIWFFYVPASLLVGVMSDYLTCEIEKFGHDPGYDSH